MRWLTVTNYIAVCEECEWAQVAENSTVPDARRLMAVARKHAHDKRHIVQVERGQVAFLHGRERHDALDGSSTTH